jgi:hypothetical protein
MALPASAQAQKDALEAAGTSNVKPIEPVKPVEVVPAEGKVTISREEFNEMQAAADRVKAAEGRTEILQGDLEVLQRRLTDLETASKGKSSSDPAPAPAPVVAIPAVAYTDKEKEDYGESKDYIRKVGAELLSEVMLPAFKTYDDRLAALEEKLNTVNTVATQASQRTAQSAQKSYTDKVREKVPEFDECVNSKHWPSFVQAMEGMSGLTYAECIQNNLNRENVDGMVNVFNTFKTKYGIGKKPDDSGYVGANPSGTTETPNDGTEGKEVLKFSDRKDLNKRFMSGKITQDEYQTERAKYELAEKEGRLNYDA